MFGSAQTAAILKPCLNSLAGQRAFGTSPCTQQVVSYYRHPQLRQGCLSQIFRQMALLFILGLQIRANATAIAVTYLWHPFPVYTFDSPYLLSSSNCMATSPHHTSPISKEYYVLILSHSDPIGHTVQNRFLLHVQGYQSIQIAKL